ncbi:hypothetical protein ACH5RR_007399 [Cinchona calisaya]|uniref:Cytochrome P450 n=1 Tax=Cinchona calisaya TaxID=153742 RepID=A0ABD3ART7_9GENT
MVFISNILFYSLFITIWFVSIFLIRSNVKQRSISKSQIQHPPSPPALPVIGHLHLLGPSIAKTFQALSARYGPLMRLNIILKNTIIVSDAATAKEILKDNEMSFASRPDFRCSGYNIYERYTFMFAEYGSYWRYMKKLFMSELLSVSQVNYFAGIRRDEMMKLLESLVSFSEKGKACNLGMELFRFTNNVTCRMLMSTRCSVSEDESKKIWDLVKEVEEVSLKFSMGELLGPLGKLDLFGHGRKMKALLLSFDSMVERIIAEHEKDMKSGKRGRNKDILDLLLEICMDENAEVKLTRMHIKTFLWELFMAGTETTMVAMQWTIAELINNPKQFKILRDEINRVVGSKRLVQESDIPNLPYLQGVVKESMRLHPPAALALRRCDKDCKINGYDILANERIIINLYSIMKDPNMWENPLDFVPERFMTKSQGGHIDQVDDTIKGQNFKNLPFGYGRRGCPGENLALASIHEAVATIVQCFDFEVEDGKELNVKKRQDSPMECPIHLYAIPLHT